MRLKPLIVAALLSLALPALAHASPGAVIRDCADDGTLQGHYSDSDLRQAQKTLPADLDEYSDCREVIGAAITGGPGKKGGSGGGAGKGGGGSSAAKRRHARADAAALKALAKKGKKPSLRIGGKRIEAGSDGLFRVAGAAHGVPLSLLLALIAVGVAGVGGAAYALRRRFPALVSIPFPSLPRVRLPRLRR